MTTVPAGQRLWKCPDCGTEILLPVTRLDPMACDACLAKLKTGGSHQPSIVDPNAAVTFVQSKAGMLLIVGLVAFALGLLMGSAVGFIVGRATVPQPFVRPSRPSDDSEKKAVSDSKADQADREGPDESTRPGPGYRWVRGYIRKDGVNVKGHWAKDPNYSGHEKETASPKKSR